MRAGSWIGYLYSHAAESRKALHFYSVISNLLSSNTAKCGRIKANIADSLTAVPLLHLSGFRRKA